MVNWTDIHPDFSKKYVGKTYQQLWEKRAFACQEAKEWIQVGFKPSDYFEVNQWKILDFTLLQVKSWIDIGLSKKDADFATCLRNKNHQPSLNLNWKQLKTEFYPWWENPPVQKYLDAVYLSEQRNTIEELVFPNKNLKGSLELKEFINLIGLHCQNNQLTKIKLSTNGEKLERLDLSNNDFPEQDLSFLSHLVNLKWLGLSNNKFYGSLEFLRNMSKLERLNISDTNIDNGLEYLPESLKEFYCSVDKRKDAKCKKLYQKLNPIFGTKKTLQEWKKANLPKLNQQKLQDQIKFLEEQKQKLIQRIAILETLTTENKKLIKEQKEKIVNDYLFSFTEEEKEALEELVKIHKTYLETKKHREETNKLFKQFIALRQKLENKLGEKFIEAVEIILTNFEELYQREWDLQKQLEEKETNTSNQQLIEEKLEKSKQALIYFTEQEKQIAENNYLLGQLGKVEELACLQDTKQQPQIIQTFPKTN